MGWLNILKGHATALQDYHRDLEQLRTTFTDQLKRAKTWEETLRHQGALKAVDEQLTQLSRFEKGEREHARRQSERDERERASGEGR